MIPSGNITSPDADGRMWVVASDPRNVWGADDIFDRPCDTCDGRGDETMDSMLAVGVPGGMYPIGPCPDCHGTGRHTFEIEVAYTHREMGCTRSEVEEVGGIWPHHTLLVHVVPGMVLPIVEALMAAPPPTSAVEMVPSGTFVLRTCLNHIAWKSFQYSTITLPPAAKPGGCAVQVVTVTDVEVLRETITKVREDITKRSYWLRPVREGEGDRNA